jgi:hypothetical protein
MISKIKSRFVSTLLSVIAAALAISCDNDDAITYSVQDVSSRITGFSTEVTGPGATLTITGSDMDKVVRVFFDNVVVTANAFQQVSSSGITLQVPLTVSLGENDVLIVYQGNGRAFRKINVIPMPAISSFTPASVVEGEPVTVLGTNLAASYVTGVTIGGVAANIVTQTNNALIFAAPAGFNTNKVALIGAAGNVNSADDLKNCDDSPNSVDCKAALNLNPGFEEGEGADFAHWGKWNGGTYMVATTVPGEYYRGTRALKVIRDGSLASGQWRIQLANDPATWEVGASYTVHVWAKASAPGGSMRVSTNPNAMYTGDQEVPTTWTRLSFTFPSANEASSRVVLDLNGNNTAVTTFYIDDVKLIKN